MHCPQGLHLSTQKVSTHCPTPCPSPLLSHPHSLAPLGPVDGMHLSLAVKAQDLEADAGGPARLNLMQVAEQVEPSSAPAIVQLSLGQDSKQSRLPRVHVPQDSHTKVQKLWMNCQR